MVVSPYDGIVADVAVRGAAASAVAGEIDQVIIEALEALARRAGVGRAYVTLIHDGGTIEVSHEWTGDVVIPQRPAVERLEASDYAASVQLALDGEVLSAPDLSALPDEFAAERASFSSFGVEAVLQVPFRIGDAHCGLIGFNQFHVVDDWPEDLIDAVGRVGSLIGAMLVRERLAAGLRDARREAELANRDRDALVREMSHELRTPLHAILGYAELLGIDARSDTDRAALAEIQRSGRHLLTMVDDLLSLASDDPVASEVVELEPLATEMMETIGRAAAARSIELRLGPGLAGSALRFELGRIRQLLYCLLSGAVQAVDASGEVTIDVVETEPEPWIRLHLTALEASSTADEVVTPLGRLLVQQHGKFDIVEHADGTVDVDVRFGQIANP